MPKAVIIGAGIGGSTLALLLKRFTNIQPLLYERAPSFNHIGAGLTLAPNALNSLDQLGLMPKLKAISQQVNDLNLYSSPKRSLTKQISSDWYQQMYGHPLLAFERANLQALLVSELRENGVEVHFGHNCVGVTDDAGSDAAVVSFENGEEVRGDVVVGADGGNSFLRSFTAQGEGGIRYSGWTTLYGITEPIEEAPTEDQARIVSDVGVPYGCWPLPGKRQFWAITLNEPFPGVWPGEESLKKSLEGCQDLWFPESYGGGGRFVKSVVDRSVRMMKLPLMSGHWEKTNLGRIVLIGDAAHTLVPFAGQGACQAIEDAVTLTNSLLTLPGSSMADSQIPREDVSRALDAHTAIRRPRVERVIKFGESTGRVSMSQSRIVNSLTGVMLKVTSTSRIAKSVEWLYGPKIVVEKPEKCD